ncbi:MAG: polyhydroxyalkanoate synthesis repressor PhaR, partial [Silicimonas sp.]|nr:polyhydroxyalkanoate synthesis repressor PhaR [Silicimonas sp.]
GENVLPVDVLTDLVRSYTTQAQSIVPQFLAMSFEMLREGQSKVMESMTNPMSAMPGFEAMKAQQEAFLRAMTGGLGGAWPPEPQETTDDKDGSPETNEDTATAELDQIRAQLAAMQAQLAKMGKKS